jgi:hypothetical protein
MSGFVIRLMTGPDRCTSIRMMQTPVRWDVFHMPPAWAVTVTAACVAVPRWSLPTRRGEIETSPARPHGAERDVRARSTAVCCRNTAVAADDRLSWVQERPRSGADGLPRLPFRRHFTEGHVRGTLRDLGAIRCPESRSLPGCARPHVPCDVAERGFEETAQTRASPWSAATFVLYRSIVDSDQLASTPPALCGVFG